MAQPPPAPCRHFERTGACRYGDACAFAHIARDTHATSTSLDAPLPARARRQTRKKDARAKVIVFRRFLERTFNNLSDARIVDIAGGKGVLSFELLNYADSRVRDVCVIDPRVMKLSRQSERWSRGFHVSGRGTTPMTHDVRIPSHCRVFFNRDTFSLDDDSHAERVRASHALARSTRWCASGLVADDNCDDYSANKDARVRVTQRGVDAPNVVITEDEGMGVEDTLTTLREALTNATLVLGMHPDQATDAAVTFACERGLPFAVVPCCVYAKEFSRRRLRDGTQVTTHEQLCAYLMEKTSASGAEVRMSTLDMRGKNVVIWSLGAVPMCRAIE